MKKSMVRPGMVFAANHTYDRRSIWMVVACSREVGEVAIDFIVVDPLTKTTRLERLGGQRSGKLFGFDLIWSP